MMYEMQIPKAAYSPKYLTGSIGEIAKVKNPKALVADVRKAANPISWIVLILASFLESEI